MRSKVFTWFANQIFPWVMTLWLVCTSLLEDTAASNFKIEVTRVSTQLLPLEAFSNYITCRLTNLQRSGICTYKIRQETP